MLLLKCTGHESALTSVHFNGSVLCNTKLAAMVKRFGLESSNFLSGYYQRLNPTLNDNGIKIDNLMSMRVLNAKRPQTPILTKTFIYTNTDGPIFSKLSQMDSLTTKRNKTAPKSTQCDVK